MRTPYQIARQLVRPIKPIVVVHGGAWAIPDALRDASLAGVQAAVEAAYSRLAEGASALDGVEAAVNALERNVAFNAGRGASLNAVGEVELDAVIVDGRTLGAGAVAGIGPVLHPVSVARQVMEHTEHVMLVGTGATAFAREMGVPILDPSELVTPEARAEWQAMAAYTQSVATFYNTERAAPPLTPGHDTVGAVALDAEGNLAAATSTGGITFKRVGRVGDSPLLGSSIGLTHTPCLRCSPRLTHTPCLRCSQRLTQCPLLHVHFSHRVVCTLRGTGSGALADNERGAISTTGHGESILKYNRAPPPSIPPLVTRGTPSLSGLP